MGSKKPCEKSLSHHYANPFRVQRHLNKTRIIPKSEINMDSKDALVVFEGTKIRRTWHDDQWYFSVVDVVQVLTDSPTPRQYWGKIKDREFQQIELSPIWVQLKLPSADGKSYKTDCSNNGHYNF